LGIQLVSSARDIFLGEFFAFDHGNLLGCGHEGQLMPLVRDLRPICRLLRH
jgi:hypothetical protein